ncbi:MarR family transcriptional regulator [Streptomyces naphthomycinicus]|uniref:MarR family transcriptional regulator n=1 Tax=Streptomyces naphthomycinicus TaxID=2872625 RepID=UPI001CED317E|nr:MarR family transcriptional regulator [Streptomyces sp. TML10]
MTTTAPRADGRTVALAHYAARALLERTLAPHGISFLQSVTLRLAVVAEGPVERAGLIDGAVGAVKIDAAEAERAVGELTAAGLVTPEGPSRVRATDAGRRLYGTASGESAAIAERLYEGISEEDRAVAGRVLTLVAQRADAELAALGQR